MRSIAELMDLNGRRVLITGGAGHIGYSAAETLAELGATIALLDLDHESCRARADGLRTRYGVRVHPIGCDLLDEQDTRRAATEAIERLGGIDVLLHCAGYVGTTEVAGWVGPIEEQTVAAWDEGMRVNLTAAFVLVQECRSALANATGGSVILLASIHGIVAQDHSLYEGTDMGTAAAYGASKGGLLQLTRYLASVLAPKIRVNAISPGGVQRGQPGIFVQRYVERTPLGRMATEEDLKGVIAYLSGDLSAYVTGQNIIVDGGLTLW